MAGIVKNIFKMSVIALAIPAVALGAQRVNPRAGGVRTNQAPDNSATSVISRSVAKDGRQTRSAVNASSIKSLLRQFYQQHPNFRFENQPTFPTRYLNFPKFHDIW